MQAYIFQGKRENNWWDEMDPFAQNPLPTVIVLFILAVVVVILNTLACIVLLKGNRRKLPVEYPLISLLLANGIMGLISLPAYAIKKLQHDRSHHACDVFRFTYFVGAHIALFSLLGTSTERIIALAYPLRYRKLVTKKRAVAGIIGVWSFVILLDIIPFFPGHSDQTMECHYNPQRGWSIAMITLTNIIPFPLLLANFAYIIRIAVYHTEKQSTDGLDERATKKWRSRSVKEKFQVIAQLRATKRIIIILTAYIVCWGPSCIYYMLASLCPESCFAIEKENYEVKQWIRFILKLLVLLHALVAPVVFCWRSKIFRNQAREVLRLSELKSCKNGSIHTQSEYQQPANEKAP